MVAAIQDLKRRRRTVVVAFFVGFIGWMIMSCGSFLLIGETWGMIWFVLHWPLSDLFEEIAGIGADSYVIVSLVTLVYATIAGGIVTLLALLVQFSVRRRS